MKISILFISILFLLIVLPTIQIRNQKKCPSFRDEVVSHYRMRAFVKTENGEVEFAATENGWEYKNGSATTTWPEGTLLTVEQELVSTSTDIEAVKFNRQVNACRELNNE